MTNLYLFIFTFCHSIYKEIGPGKRISLTKLAVEKLEDSGRPLRIAIDISIWQFQVQAARGKTNESAGVIIMLYQHTDKKHRRLESRYSHSLLQVASTHWLVHPAHFCI